MNSNQDSQNTGEISEEIEADNSLSIDAFIKELEAKEKDLNIHSELVIEVDENDFDDENTAEFAVPQFPVFKNESPPAPPALPKSSFAPNSAELTDLKNEIQNLKNQNSKLETERAELVDLARRRQTDFENYKNRTERERSETFRAQLGNLARQMLPVLDNMNRALTATAKFTDGGASDFQQFFDGIGLVNQQLNEVLAEMGVHPIVSVGSLFDPHLHEAVAAEESNEFPPNTVIEEFIRGYRIDEKVIRPAMVKVSKNEK